MKLNLFLIILLLCLNFLCSDDQKSNSQPYRINRITIYQDEQYQFYYKDERLNCIEYFDYQDDQWCLYAKDSIKYDNTTVTVTSLLLEQSDNTFKEISKIIYTRTNQRISEITEYEYFQENWIPYYKATYQYQNDELVSYQEYYVDFEGNPNYESELIYENNQLTTIHQYYCASGRCDSNNQILFEYENDQLSIRTDYFYSGTCWKEQNQTVYEWTNNKINSMDFYENKNEDWQLVMNKEFNYNQSGRLDLVNVIYLNETEYSEIGYQYEEGEGNAEFFRPPQINLNQEPNLTKESYQRQLYSKYHKMLELLSPKKNFFINIQDSRIKFHQSLKGKINIS